MSRQNNFKKIVAVFACYMVLTLNFSQLYASGPGDEQPQPLEQEAPPVPAQERPVVGT